MSSLHMLCLLTLAVVVQGKSKEIAPEELLQEITGLFRVFFHLLFTLTVSGMNKKYMYNRISDHTIFP